MKKIIVTVTRYDDAGTYYVAESSDIPGLVIEGDSLDHVIQQLPQVIEDLQDDTMSISTNVNNIFYHFSPSMYAIV